MLKKTSEAPYTTKVNYRELTSRGTTLDTGVLVLTEHSQACDGLFVCLVWSQERVWRLHPKRTPCSPRDRCFFLFHPSSLFLSFFFKPVLTSRRQTDIRHPVWPFNCTAAFSRTTSTDRLYGCLPTGYTYELSHSEQSSFLRWFTACCCWRYLRRPTCECVSAPGGRGSASDAQCSAGLTSLGALLKVLTSHHGGVC